mgnify:CR=1 FL=1
MGRSGLSATRKKVRRKSKSGASPTRGSHGWVASPLSQGNPCSSIARGKATMHSAGEFASPPLEPSVACEADDSPRAARKDDVVIMASAIAQRAGAPSGTDGVRAETVLHDPSPGCQGHPPESTDNVRDVYQQCAGSAATQSSGREPGTLTSTPFKKKSLRQNRKRMPARSPFLVDESPSAQDVTGGVGPSNTVSYTHIRAHETTEHIVLRVNG